MNFIIVEWRNKINESLKVTYPLSINARFVMAKRIVREESKKKKKEDKIIIMPDTQKTSESFNSDIHRSFSIIMLTIILFTIFKCFICYIKNLCKV